MNSAYISAPTLASRPQVPAPRQYSHAASGGMDPQILGLSLHRPTHPAPLHSDHLPNRRPSMQVGGWPTGHCMDESGRTAGTQWSFPQSGSLGNWNKKHPIITTGPYSVSVYSPFSPSSNSSSQISLGPCTIHSDRLPGRLATLRPIKVSKNNLGNS